MNSENPNNRKIDPMSADAVAKLAGTGAAAQVKHALSRASEATGVDFDVLYNMARRESSLDPSARAKTSSAAGLFQFIDQTWLGMVKKHGARHGLAAEAEAITRNAAGRYEVADPNRREAILNLRFNPIKAAALAGELVRENRLGLERRLGRAVNNAEIYAAHFLGAGGAAKLLSAPPDARAADLLPKAAAVNRAVFYEGSRARTVSELMASIESSMSAGANGSPRDKSHDLETKSAGFQENLFSAQAAFSEMGEDAGAGERRLGEAIARAYALPREEAGRSMTPLMLAILQAFDPAGIGANRDDRETRLF